MKEVFAAQLTDRTPAGRKMLITALVAQADKSADVPAERFVLLAAAYDAAIEAVDLPQALRFADEMARHFDVDALAIKAAAVPTLIAKPSASREITLANARSALDLANELSAAEDFAAATRVCQAIVPASAADAELRVQVQNRLREIAALRDSAGKVAKEVEKLKTNPNDPAANLAVGRHYCFLKNDWGTGLPLLARSGDAELKLIAAQELTVPTEPSAIARLADAWWSIANKQSDSLAKIAVTAHAAALYNKAFPNLAGLQRELATRRLADAAKLIPAPATSGPRITAPSGKSTRTTVTVAANKPWQTGFEVHAGDLLVFTVTGQVTTHPSRQMTGPEGFPVGGRPYGCLRAQIGEQPVRDLFTVGANSRHFVGRDGLISFRVDDFNDREALNDNRGEFNVMVDVYAAAVKPPLALGKAEQFIVPATDIVGRLVKAGTYDITAEGQWSHMPEGNLYGPEGTKGSTENMLICKFAKDNHVVVGKGTRVTLEADEILRFKIRDDDGGLTDNRGSMTVSITPLK